MKLHLNKPDTLQIIGSFDTDCLTIGEQRYEKSVILTPQRVELWPVSHVSELTRTHFTEIARHSVETVILGTGATGIFVDVELTRPLIEKNIGLEVMTTAAACRTWNVLAADGRRVACALIIEAKNA